MEDKVIKDKERIFLIYSKKASTAPRISDLKKAGRIDILLHSIISALFTSNNFRKDVKLHLILMGPPNPPKHILIRYNENNTISKKDLKKLLEIALRKAKKGRIIEAHPGVFVDEKTIEDLINDFKKENKKIFLLDKNGTPPKEINKKDFENGVFILGDHEGFSKKVKKYIKKNAEKISLGEVTYFTSQAITIINYELDNI